MQRLFNTAYNTGICCNATPPSCLGMFFASHACVCISASVDTTC